MSGQEARFEAILDDCLSDLQSGRASVDSCLARHADLAPQLAPLLAVATRLQQEPQPVLPDAARQRIETQVMDRLRQSPPRQPAHVRPASFSGLLRWAATVALTVLVLSIFTGGTIGAADSLPGEPFYSFKTAGEQVEAWLTSPQDQANLHLKFAVRRLDEVIAMGHRGVVDDLAIIQMESETRQAMEQLTTLPGDQQSQLAQELLALTERQRVMLDSLKAYTAPWSQAGLEWGIDNAIRRAAVLEGIRE
jgi:hypothetical protein